MSKKKRKILHLLITLVIESSPGLDLRATPLDSLPNDMETMKESAEKGHSRIL